MLIQDDRTPATHETHSVLITATDKFLSGWRCHPLGFLSKAAWCCRPEHANLVYQWVKSCPSYKYVNRNKASWCPRKASHVHYYVISDGHDALGGAS